MTVAVRPGPRQQPGVEHPSLVPAQLLAGPGPERGPDLPGGAGGPGLRRSVRDWVVDVTCFLIAVLAGAAMAADAANGSGPLPPAPVPLVVVDVVFGFLGCVALWWRRRWPVQVAVALGTIGAFSDMVAAAAVIALFSLAVHRRWPPVLVVSVYSLAVLWVYTWLRPVGDLPIAVFWVMCVLLTAAVVAWGMFVRARRQLVLSLHERAVRAENEQALRVDQARHLERARIAREMHDVLAHRLSLLSMHAGALEFRPDAPPAEVAQAAGVVRASARQALEDLREVIGVLRESPDEAGRTRPQPGLADVPALIEEVREAGLRVRAEYGVPDLGAAPSVTGRTAYRVVQEGLTNVRKHAPGTVATVSVTGGPGTGLTVDVRSPAPTGGAHADALPGAGTGLVGLLERVTLAGGGLAHGWTADGEFRLTATLPWPA